MSKQKVPGWDDNHVEFLTHMAHQMNGLTDFDDEVQKHLDRLYAPKGVETTEDDLSSPEDDQGQREIHQKQEIRNHPPTMTPPPNAADLS